MYSIKTLIQKREMFSKSSDEIQRFVQERIDSLAFWRPRLIHNLNVRVDTHVFLPGTEKGPKPTVISSYVKTSPADGNTVIYLFDTKALPGVVFAGREGRPGAPFLICALAFPPEFTGNAHVAAEGPQIKNSMRNRIAPAVVRHDAIIFDSHRRFTDRIANDVTQPRINFDWNHSYSPVC